MTNAWNPQNWSQLSAFELPVIVDKPISTETRMIFDFWVETLRSKSRNRTFLSDKRRRKIERALGLYGFENCKKAILGCSLSDYHLGKNQTGTKYDDVELILRDEQHIDRFIHLYEDHNDKDF